MIQELLGGASAANLNFGSSGDQRKIYINNGSNTILEGTFISSPSPSPSPSSSSTKSTNSTPSSTTTTNPENQNNLRCPRCDSPNTKFCYYNNYNLTQPRHFCKTCRRYWTKGGALRNVPIGGGCRKNKNTIITTSVGKSSSCAASNKMKTVVLSHEIGRSSSIGLGNLGFGHHHHHQSPQYHESSHLLALLRSTAPQNPNPSIKEEVSQMLETHVTAVATGGALNGRTLGGGLDPLSQAPSLGLCSPFWKNTPQNENNGFLLGEVQNTGIQELYQRLKSSSSYNYSEHNSAAANAVVLSNVTSNSSSSLSLSSSSSSSSILESAPVASSAGGELGNFWNNYIPAFSSSPWSSTYLPTSTNGAYH